ncbi:MAG: hypothetical protein R3B84_22430 [Zavarzinella sp.]
MTFWVHREADGRPWYESEIFEPPLEAVVPGKGFPLFFVEYRNFTFFFSSLAEMRVAIEVLGKKLLPTTRRLSAERASGMGPNRHLLSRLPGFVMPWRYRERAVAYFVEALNDFERELSRS